MYTRTIGRFGAAAVLAVGLLMATTLPASASATGVVIEASSTIVLQPSTGGSPVANVHIKGHSTTNVCAPNSTTPTAIPVALDSTGGGTISPSTTGYGDFAIFTSTFKSRLIINSGTVTFSTTGATVTLSISAEFRTCNSQTVLCLTNPVNVTMTGPSVGHHPTASTRVTVAGLSGHITAPFTCNPILRAALNSTHAVASLNLHFV